MPRLMDKLLTDHMILLQKYSVLQVELSILYQSAFVQLSRCRYNGIQLSSNSFRQDFEPCLSVKNTETTATTVNQRPEDLDSLSDLLTNTHISSDFCLKKGLGRPPMMDIQALPSASLKKTVTCFDVALQKSVELCRIVSQLRATEDRIQELKQGKHGNPIDSSNTTSGENT